MKRSNPRSSRLALTAAALASSIGAAAWLARAADAPPATTTLATTTTAPAIAPATGPGPVTLPVAADVGPATNPATGPTTVAATGPTTTTAPATTTASATLPSTTQVSIPITTPPGMRDRFGVLLSRSIFSKERIRPYDPLNPDGRTPSGPFMTAPPVQYVPTRQEASLALKGVVDQDGEYVAFIEDMNTGRTTQFKVNDGVAHGKISAITFDTLEYEAGGRITRVEIGQNLDGGMAVPGTLPSGGLATGTPAATGAPGTPPATGPSFLGGPPANPAINDVLERMRRARLMGK